MQIRGGKLAKTRQLARLGQELSRGAQLRLHWMTHYLDLARGRNAAFTCRHFGITIVLDKKITVNILLHAVALAFNTG